MSCRSSATSSLVAIDAEGGHLQSLILGAVLLIMAFLSLMLGIVSDLIRTNRVLIEDTLEHTKRMRFGDRRQDPPQSSIHSDGPQLEQPFLERSR